MSLTKSNDILKKNSFVHFNSHISKYNLDSIEDYQDNKETLHLVDELKKTSILRKSSKFNQFNIPEHKIEVLLIYSKSRLYLNLSKYSIF